MLANQTEICPSNICGLKRAKKFKFTEECIMRTEKNILVKKKKKYLQISYSLVCYYDPE